MSDTGSDMPPTAEQQVGLQRRSFVRAVSRDALHAAAVLVGASEAVRSAALRAVIAARPTVNPERTPAPIDAAPTGASGHPGGPPAYRLDDTGQLRITDRTLLPGGVKDAVCANGSDLARLLGRHVVGSGPVLGELAAYALAGTASAVASMDQVGQANVLRATSAIIAATRPASGAMEHALTASADLWAADSVTAMSEGLRALGDSLSIDLAAAIDAIAGHTASLAATVLAAGGDMLLHGGFARLATGTRGAAASLLRDTRALGLQPGVWITDGGPGREGRIATLGEAAEAERRAALVADAVVGSLIASGRIRIVMVSAERVLGDGTVVGPVGTYALAVLAALHRIPFLVLAPTVAVDGWDGIQRSWGVWRLPTRASDRPGALSSQVPDVPPLMDETPPELVTAVVTEVGPR